MSTAAHITYEKPPIVEAVIAVHFSTPLEQKSIQRFARKCKENLPFSEDIIEMLGMVNVQTQQQTSNVAKIGDRLSSTDRTRILTILPNQLAVSQMAPYTDWDTFYKEARAHWDVLIKIDGHQALSRVSTRFVNRIDIPVGEDGYVDLHKYFSAGLSLPPYVQAMALQSFYVNCSLLDPDTQCMNILQLSATPSPLIDHMSFNIDIDIATTKPVPSREDAIWELIYKLREYKNNLFESCITPETRELFQ